MAGATIFTLAALTSLSDPALALGFTSSLESDVSHVSSFASLAELALDKVLSDAAPVFGTYANEQSDTANWMRAYYDDTLIVHMNLPGVHDADTWNYSLATQQSLDHVTDLVAVPQIDPAYYRCQTLPMTRMLDAGVRVFDLRYAFDVTSTQLVFWHGTGLVSETATVDDVLFAFYQWLEDHPSEAIFLSFQYEGGTFAGASANADVQLLLHGALTSPAARRYFVQKKGSLGTLGQARGKATLFRRFDLDLLPQSYTDSLPGLHFSPRLWTDNSPNITLIYNNATSATAYIEDYYQPLTPAGSSATENIQWKLNATEAHLLMAAASDPASLFWSFASSTNLGDFCTPQIQALGNGTDTPGGGVNDRLIPFLRNLQGKRLGILMFDFFEQPSDLIPLYLSLLSPLEALFYGV